MKDSIRGRRQARTLKQQLPYPYDQDLSRVLRGLKRRALKSRGKQANDPVTAAYLNAAVRLIQRHLGPGASRTPAGSRPGCGIPRITGCSRRRPSAGVTRLTSTGWSTRSAISRPGRYRAVRHRMGRQGRLLRPDGADGRARLVDAVDPDGDPGVRRVHHVTAADVDADHDRQQPAPKRRPDAEDRQA